MRDQKPQMKEAVKIIRKAAPDLIAFHNQSWQLEALNGHQENATTVSEVNNRHRTQSTRLLEVIKQRQESTNDTSDELPPLSSTMHRTQDDIIKLLEDFNNFQNQAARVLQTIIDFQDLIPRMYAVLISLQEDGVYQDVVRIQHQAPLYFEFVNDQQNRASPPQEELANVDENQAPEPTTANQNPSTQERHTRQLRPGPRLREINYPETLSPESSSYEPSTDATGSNSLGGSRESKRRRTDPAVPDA